MKSIATEVCNLLYIREGSFRVYNIMIFPCRNVAPTKSFHAKLYPYIEVFNNIFFDST